MDPSDPTSENISGRPTDDRRRKTETPDGPDDRWRPNSGRGALPPARRRRTRRRRRAPTERSRAWRKLRYQTVTRGVSADVSARLTPDDEKMSDGDGVTQASQPCVSEHPAHPHHRVGEAQIVGFRSPLRGEERRDEGTSSPPYAACPGDDENITENPSLSNKTEGDEHNAGLDPPSLVEDSEDYGTPALPDKIRNGDDSDLFDDEKEKNKKLDPGEIDECAHPSTQLWGRDKHNNSSVTPAPMVPYWARSAHFTISTVEEDDDRNNSISPSSTQGDEEVPTPTVCYDGDEQDSAAMVCPMCKLSFARRSDPALSRIRPADPCWLPIAARSTPPDPPGLGPSSFSILLPTVPISPRRQVVATEGAWGTSPNLAPLSAPLPQNLDDAIAGMSCLPRRVRSSSTTAPLTKNDRWKQEDPLSEKENLNSLGGISLSTVESVVEDLSLSPPLLMEQDTPASLPPSAEREVTVLEPLPLEDEELSDSEPNFLHSPHTVEPAVEDLPLSPPVLLEWDTPVPPPPSAEKEVTALEPLPLENEGLSMSVFPHSPLANNDLEGISPEIAILGRSLDDLPTLADTVQDLVIEELPLSPPLPDEQDTTMSLSTSEKEETMYTPLLTEEADGEDIHASPALLAREEEDKVPPVSLNLQKEAKLQERTLMPSLVRPRPPPRPKPLVFSTYKRQPRPSFEFRLASLRRMNYDSTLRD